MAAPSKRFAGVELGGTSWLLAIAVDDPQNIVERTRIETTTPAETLGAAVAWLQTQTFDVIGGSLAARELLSHSRNQLTRHSM